MDLEERTQLFSTILGSWKLFKHFPTEGAFGFRAIFPNRVFTAPTVIFHAPSLVEEFHTIST